MGVFCIRNRSLVTLTILLTISAPNMWIINNSSITGNNLTITNDNNNLLIITANPTVSVSANPSLVDINQTVTITATADDDEIVSRIEVYVDNALVNNCTINSKSGNCIYQTSYPSLNPLLHPYYAIAVDNSGNSVQTSEQHFQMWDATYPQVTVSANPNPVEAAQAITLFAYASDNLELYRIEMFIDWSNMGACYMYGHPKSGNCTYQTSFSSPGNHTFQAIAADGWGNTKDASVGIVVKPESIKPTITSYANPSHVNISQSIEVGATASDNALVATIEVFIDNVSVTFCNANKKTFGCGYIRSYSVPGIHYYYAIATDSSGNTAQTSEKNFTVGNDKIKPIAASLASPSFAFIGEIVTITANATDDNLVSKIKIYVDNVVQKDCTINAKSGSCIYSTSYSSKGTHTYYAVAIDSSANYGKTITNSFRIHGSGNESPQIYISYSPYGNPRVNQTINIVAMTVDDWNVTTITINLDGNDVITCDINNEKGYCSFSFIVTVPSPHYYYAIARDNNGNVAQSIPGGFWVSK